MNQVPVQNQRPPVYYDPEYVESLFRQSGFTNLEVAYRSRHSPTTVREVRTGKSNRLDFIFNIVVGVLNGSLERTFKGADKFHRAARQNGSGAVSDRSTGGVGRSKAR